MEIERKFLVRSQEYRKEAVSKSHIVQGFLNTDPERTVRIRLKDEHAFLTIKGKSNASGTIRQEWEFAIDADAARGMLLLCEEPLIEKLRFCVHAGNHLYEIDEFQGENEGLIVAEIELNEENEAFDQPSWLGSEVTGEIKYYNSQLSKIPYRKWQR